MTFWNWSESDVAAVFDNRSAGTMQIHINIFALVNSDLSRGNKNDAILHAGDVSSSSYMSGNNQRILDVLQCQTGEWCSV